MAAMLPAPGTGIREMAAPNDEKKSISFVSLAPGPAPARTPATATTVPFEFQRAVARWRRPVLMRSGASSSIPRMSCRLPLAHASARLGVPG